MARRSHSGVTEQTKASVHRLEDAQSLLAAGRWRGAMYLGGYSVECLLKAKLMKRFDCPTLESLQDELRRRNLISETSGIWTHSIEILLRLADGLGRCRSSTSTWRDFRISNHWAPAWRYDPNLSNRDDAMEFLDAIERLRKWIDHNI